MLPYLFFIYIIVMLSIISVKDKYNALVSKLYIPINLPLFIFFGGLASSRGDYKSYKLIFNYPEKSHVETGFIFLNNVVRDLGGNYHDLLLITVALSVLLKLVAFKKNTPYFTIAVIIYTGVYFVPAEMGSLRFGIAMAFFLFSIHYIHEKKFLPFLIIIIISSTIHIFSLAVVLLYIFNLFNFKRKDYVLLFILSIFFYLFFINKFSNFLEKILPSNNIYLSRGLRYLFYQDAVKINFAIVKRILLFIISLIFFNKFKIILPNFKVIFNSYFLSIIIFFIFSGSFTFANRSSWFFASVEPILLTGFIGTTNNKMFKYLIITLLIAYSILSLVHTLRTQSDNFNLYLPYNNIFF